MSPEVETLNAQIAFPWKVAIEGDKSEQQIIPARELLGFYDPEVYRIATDEVFPEGLTDLTSQEIVSKIHYHPLWMESLFGARWPSNLTERQLKRESDIATENALLYSPEAIKLALHLNREGLGTERRIRHPWYECKPATHPIFFLNFLRFSLRNGIFNNLEEAIDLWLANAKELGILDDFSLTLNSSLKFTSSIEMDI